LAAAENPRAVAFRDRRKKRILIQNDFGGDQRKRSGNYKYTKVALVLCHFTKKNTKCDQIIPLVADNKRAYFRYAEVGKRRDQRFKIFPPVQGRPRPEKQAQLHAATQILQQHHLSARRHIGRRKVHPWQRQHPPCTFGILHKTEIKNRERELRS